MTMLKPGMLAGSRYKEMIKIEEVIDGELKEFELEIQALKKSQITRVLAIQYNGIKANPTGRNDNVEVEISETYKNNSEAMLAAAEAGLGGETTGWTKEVIDDQISPDNIDKIGKRVMVISGHGEPAEVEKFRQERRK